MIIEVAIIIAIIMTIIISSSIIIATRGNNSRTDRSIVALVNMFHCRCSRQTVTNDKSKSTGDSDCNRTSNRNSNRATLAEHWDLQFRWLGVVLNYCPDTITYSSSEFDSG